MGRGTYNDIPRHVNAAIRILKLRLLDRPLSISRPFDRLAVESVLYQIFLVTMGSWSDYSALGYQFDAGFWLRAENLLAQSMLFPSTSISTNSPVLGVPMDLFKLVLSIRRLWESPFRHDEETLDELRTELDEWERTIIVSGPASPDDQSAPPDSHYELYKDATALYVLVSSLLVQELCEGHTDEIGIGIGPPEPVPPDCWQVEKAAEILRRHEHDIDWARCYIGNWPVYTLGFFMSSPDDIQLVRDDMRRRWDSMRFSQLERFRNELEAIWIQREALSQEA
jgi:hypothetical protein